MFYHKVTMMLMYFEIFSWIAISREQLLKSMKYTFLGRNSYGD
jgi:hypothetical protein